MRCLSAFLALLLTSLVVVQASAQSSGVHATPPAGPVLGKLEDGLTVWQGLPYAQPPVGSLRWHAPQPMPVWAVERPALQFGNVCPQNLNLSGRQDQVRGDEDCLYLNVYAPQRASHLPVMVWIHGGSFETGAGSDYDPRPLVREQDVVVVTLNYRLGALGFLAVPGLKQGRPDLPNPVGNYGLLDQQLALKWVRHNISAFGGDASNITVFGQSAGGMSICDLLAMPGARGLFDKAIIESGPCTSPGVTVSRQDALSRGASAIRPLGCDPNDAACLRRLPAGKLALTRPPNSGTVPFPPLYGDQTMPQHPAQVLGTPQALNVPLLIGSNLDEGRAFAAFIAKPERDLNLWEYLAGNSLLNKGHVLASLFQYNEFKYGTRTLALAAANTDQAFACPTSDIARARSSFVPVYAYEFRDRSVPVEVKPTAGLPSLGAFHSAEIPFVMGTSNGMVKTQAFTPQQRDLGRTIRSYWANFARTGNPNGVGLTNWNRLNAAGTGVQELRPARIGPVNDFRTLHQCDAIWR